MNSYSGPCHYKQCQLPKDNKKYWWQVAFLVISLFILLKNPDDFTFSSIFLFICPVILDVLTTDLPSKICTYIRRIFGFVNAALLVGCILGFVDVVIDKGDRFALIPTFMFLGEMSFKKTSVAIILAVNILVPFVFMIGAPSQKALHMLEARKQKSQRRGAKNK